MKRFGTYLLPAAMISLLLLVMGNYGSLIQRTSLATPKAPWRNIGTITASQATLAVNARDYSAVTGLSDAKTMQWLTIPDDVTAVEFRFSTNADADAHVVQIWVAADDYTAGNVEDSFTLGATLTLTGGKQVGPYSNYFVDTISATETILTGSATVDSGNDRIALWRVDLRGWKRVVLIATTLQASSTLYCDVRNY